MGKMENKYHHNFYYKRNVAVDVSTGVQSNVQTNSIHWPVNVNVVIKSGDLREIFVWDELANTGTLCPVLVGAKVETR